MQEYSDRERSEWLKSAAQQSSSAHYLDDLVRRDAERYVRSHYRAATRHADIRLIDDDLVAVISDLRGFASATNWGDGSSRIVLKSLARQSKRITAMRVVAIERLPEFEGTLVSLPIRATFANPLNAGALPVPDGGSAIVLNEGIVDFAVFQLKSGTAIASTEVKCNERIEEHKSHFARSLDRRPLPTEIGDAMRIEFLRNLETIYPQPTIEEQIYTFSEVALAGLEILNLKATPKWLWSRRTDFHTESRQVIVGALEGDGFVSDRVTAEFVEPFILFHELAHVLLGHTEELREWCASDAKTAAEYEHRIVRSQEMEYEADRFAIDMLVPKQRSALWDVAGAIKCLFELFALCEMNFSRLPSELQFARKMRIDSSPDDYFQMLRARTHDHPPALARLRSLWSVLIKKQKPVDMELIRWWQSLSAVQRIDHMAMTGEGDVDFDADRLPDAEHLIAQSHSFLGDVIGALVVRLRDWSATEPLYSTRPGQSPYPRRFD